MRQALIGALGISVAAMAASGAAPPAPPTEILRVVLAADTPLLNEMEGDEPAAEVAHAGDLLEILKPLPPMKWKAHMGKVIAERDGPMAEVRLAPGDAILFGFSSDLGGEVRVPAASWMCDRIASTASLPEAARRTRCATLLRRTRLPSGAIVGFESCASGPCPVALTKNGKLTAIAVDGVVSASVVPGGADGILLLTTRWSRQGGKWTGSTLVPVAMSGGALKRLPEIPVDEVDARDPDKVISRHVEVEITSPSAASTLVRVHGLRRAVRSADAGELSSSPIDERRSLP